MKFPSAESSSGPNVVLKLCGGCLPQGVLQLGGALAKSPKECTHLVTNKILRTVKLLSAFGSAKFVVTPRWIEDSIANNAFVGEDGMLVLRWKG